MSTKRLLIAVPIVLVAILAQSSLWVPTYEHQDAGNSRRLTTYIEAGIGDAKILNPTISADGSSSTVIQHLFEGLIDIDEDGDWIGDLAERWEIEEDATLAILPGRRLPDGSPATAATVANAVQAALEAGRLPELTGAATLRVLAAEDRTETITVTETGENDRPVQRDVAVRVSMPERVVFSLDRVVSDLFERLEPILGAAVLSPEGASSRLGFDAPEDEAAVASQVDDLFSVREHNPIVTFHLRRGIRFHDGHPLDAGDVKFTYDAIMNPKNISPRTSSFEPIENVEVVDDHTVRIVYKRLYSPAIIAWTMGILPEHLMNDAAIEAEMDRRNIGDDARESFGLRNSDTARNPVGTGPFRFVEWHRDEYVHLERNDDHWKRPPEYTDLYFRVIPELVTQEVEFRSGAVDYYQAQPHQVARYRTDERYQAISAVTDAFTYIGYNMRKPPFDDVRVRKALGMAINVDELIEYVLYGEAEPISGPFYKNTPWYNHDTPVLSYDPEGAKALLAEAGWTPGPDGKLQKDGKPLAFKLITNNGNPSRKAVMTVAQNAWKRIGIDVATNAIEWTVFIEKYVNALEFDAVVLGWAGGGINPDKYQLWHSSQTNPYQLNFVGYEDDVTDDLIIKIREEYDYQSQRELSFALHDRVAAAHPYTFLYAPRVTYVLDEKMVIVDRDAEGRESYRKIYATPDGRISFHFDRWRKLAAAPVFGPEG